MRRLTTVLCLVLAAPAGLAGARAVAPGALAVGPASWVVSAQGDRATLEGRDGGTLLAACRDGRTTLAVRWPHRMGEGSHRLVTLHAGGAPERERWRLSGARLVGEGRGLLQRVAEAGHLTVQAAASPTGPLRTQRFEAPGTRHALASLARRCGWFFG